jgi:hypothetical protein
VSGHEPECARRRTAQHLRDIDDVNGRLRKTGRTFSVSGIVIAFLISLRIVSSRCGLLINPTARVLDDLWRGTSAIYIEYVGTDSSAISAPITIRSGWTAEDLHRVRPLLFIEAHLAFDFGLPRDSPSTEINSDTTRPTPPATFDQARNV